MKIAVFPGSFDPITIGHEQIVKRALPLFDKIIIAVGVNSQKRSLYTLDERLEGISRVFAHEPKIEVDQHKGLTAHYCIEKKAKYLLRGLRNASDFDYEKQLSQMNQIIGKGVETVFLISQPEYSHISSTLVREVIKGGGDASDFLPERL
jgi:pantetheine-phosphate adenylyltransferase